MEYIEQPNTEEMGTPRVPPHNDEAEKSVLGAMLMSANAVETATSMLAPGDFYSPAHRDIFTAMVNLYNHGTPIDVVTVKDALESMGRLKGTGGASYLTELSIFTPTASNISHYADIVREHGIRRRLLEISGKIFDDANNSEKDIKDSLSDAERRIFELSMNREESTLVPISGAVIASHRRIGELISLNGALSGIATGFIDLDRLTSGLQRSDLIILAARPSMGKTAFALNIATYAGLHGGATVAIFSLEMSSEQLATRMICSEAGVDMQRVKTGKPTEEDLIKIGDVVGPLERSKIYIDDTAGISVPEIRSKCRRLKAHSGLDMIVIDYLQLMQSASTRRSESRVQEVADLTRALKILARELDVPILLLSQLSREPEKRKENPRPIMSDLRESGAIEQDADVIMMLYRPQVYQKSDDNVCEVIVAKHRNGPTDTVKLAWIPENTRFTNSTEGAYYGDQ